MVVSLGSRRGKRDVTDETGDGGGGEVGIRRMLSGTDRNMCIERQIKNLYMLSFWLPFVFVY